MAILTIHQGPQTKVCRFTPPQRLSELLLQAGVGQHQPCGGRALCGKCAITLCGQASALTTAEERFGTRLSCQTVLLGDTEVTLPNLLPIRQIEEGSSSALIPSSPMAGRFGAAADIGTTTVALLLYDLHSGQCIGSSSMLNPQTSVSADVIGRIDAALHGKADMLRAQTVSAVLTLLSAACAQAGISSADVHSLVVTGNTTMLYLFTRRDPSSLAHTPFIADHFFGYEDHLLSRCIFLPHCLHAFVGADVTCGLLATGLLEQNTTSLLCDVGTNGEMALFHQGKLYITSTAAGPAFEGAGISCGCASIPGAIDHVSIVNGSLHCHTIGNIAASGICGSGLLDALAAALDLELIDESGCIEDDFLPLRDGLFLTQCDVRSVQLAKAATHAGIMCLLEAANCSADEVSCLYLAGGFGSHLNIRSAVRIGLIPAEFTNKVKVVGNAALDGAAKLLLDTSLRNHLTSLQQAATHVRLDGNPNFTQRYIDSMSFSQ